MAGRLAIHPVVSHRALWRRRVEAGSALNEEKSNVRKKKILIVEDEAHTRETMKDRLEFEGFEVITAQDGAAALKLVRTEKPDLITLDIMLPGGMDGTEVGAALAKDKRTRNIPIIYVSCLWTKEDEKIKGRVMAGQVVMAKPFNFNELIEVIKKKIH